MSARSIGTKITLGLGSFLALLALVGFSMPFVAVAAGEYEGGEQSLGGVMLFCLFAAPATILLGASALLRGWKEARAAYYVLGVMFGLPFLVLVVGIGWALIDSVFQKKST
jgi:hypothetical protein